MRKNEVFEARKNRIYVTMYCQFLTKQQTAYYLNLISDEVGITLSNTTGNIRHFSYALSDLQILYMSDSIEKNVAVFRGKLLSRINEFIIHYSDRSIQKKFINASINAMNRLSNVTGLYQ